MPAARRREEKEEEGREFNLRLETRKCVQTREEEEEEEEESA